MAVLRRYPDAGDGRLDLLTWGLVPGFTKDLKGARKPINARSESVATSGVFRQAMEKRRAIVADLFYEWRAVADGKQPFAIARVDGQPLAFAGLWEGRKSSEGEIVRTFTILTTEANTEMRAVHDRMPVVLEESAWPVWLGEEAGELGPLMRPALDGTLRLWPVSRDVNSPGHNRADLVEPITPPDAPRMRARRGRTRPKGCFTADQQLGAEEARPRRVLAAAELLRQVLWRRSSRLLPGSSRDSR